MAQNSPGSGDTDNTVHIEAQLRESYGRVVYTHKTQEKCADILLETLSRIKLSQIVLSAGSTGGFVAAILGTGLAGSIAGGTCSALLLALSLYTKQYNLGELAEQHRLAATDVWLIREKYLSVITDLATGDRGLAEIRAERDALLEQLRQVYAGMPSTTVRAYQRARQALRSAEEMTFSDKEIDELLPSALRKA